MLLDEPLEYKVHDCDEKLYKQKQQEIVSPTTTYKSPKSIQLLCKEEFEQISNKNFITTAKKPQQQRNLAGRLYERGSNNNFPHIFQVFNNSNCSIDIKNSSKNILTKTTKNEINDDGIEVAEDVAAKIEHQQQFFIPQTTKKQQFLIQEQQLVSQQVSSTTTKQQQFVLQQQQQFVTQQVTRTKQQQFDLITKNKNNKKTNLVNLNILNYSSSIPIRKNNDNDDENLLYFEDEILLGLRRKRTAFSLFKNERDGVDDDDDDDDYYVSATEEKRQCCNDDDKDDKDSDNYSASLDSGVDLNDFDINFDFIDDEKKLNNKTTKAGIHLTTTNTDQLVPFCYCSDLFKPKFER